MHYTHYDYLDLPPGASPARIEAAYHTIKQRLNGRADPDLVRMIHGAYAVLSNTQLRQRYDAELERTEVQADAELKVLLDTHASRSQRRSQYLPTPLVTIFNALAA